MSFETSGRPTFSGDALKFLLIGCGGSGKSTFIKHVATGSPPTDFGYYPTVGCELTRAMHHHWCGDIKIEYWEPGGSEKYGGLRDKYYVDGKAVIIMFDLSSRVTYKDVPHYYRSVTRAIEPNVP